MVFPEIGPGTGGGVVEGLTFRLRKLLDPQALEAVTEIMPLAEPGRTVIAVVPWPEIRVQPVGINQV